MLISRMETPENWNDATAWDRYYADHIPDLEKVEKYDLEQLLRFARNVYETPQNRIWFPGCGLDLSPWIYANLGCEVVATDISPFAIELQNELLFEDPMEVLEKLPNVLKEMELPKAGNFKHPAMYVHDMRHPFTMPPVGVIVCKDALSALNDAELAQVAAVFWNAMNEGGLLVCETHGILPSRRTALENAFHKAGFFIPCRETEQWFRLALESTEIDYEMSMGKPVVANRSRRAAAATSEPQERDHVILRDIHSEYALRNKANAAQDKLLFREGKDKLGLVI